MDIDWQETAGEAFAVRLAVTGEDRRGLYADIMESISQTGTNIKGADLHTKDGTVFGTIFVEVDNLPHLGKVMKAVRKVKGVTGNRAEGCTWELGYRLWLWLSVSSRVQATNQPAQHSTNACSFIYQALYLAAVEDTEIS